METILIKVNFHEESHTQSLKSSYMNIPYPRERGPTMECPPTPHFGLNSPFPLRIKYAWNAAYVRDVTRNVPIGEGVVNFSINFYGGSQHL